MKDHMRQFLKGLDLEEDMINAIVAEHGSIVTRYKESAETAKTKCGELETALKAYDGVDVAALRGELDALKADKEKLVADHTAALTAAQRDALIRERIAGERFTSDYAKRGVYDELKAAVVFDDDGKLTNYDEIIASLREKQPGAFCAESEATTPPKDTGRPHRSGGSEPADAFLDGFNKI